MLLLHCSCARPTSKHKRVSCALTCVLPSCLDPRQHNAALQWASGSCTCVSGLPRPYHARLWVCGLTRSAFKGVMRLSGCSK